MRRLALIGLLPGLLLTARADIFVDGSAGPGGDGSTAHPFAAIQQGLDHAKAGDSVIVRPGVYHEQIKLNHGGTAQAPLTLRAEKIGTVTVDGAAPVTDLTQDSWRTQVGVAVWRSTSYASPYMPMKDPWGLRDAWLKEGPTGAEQVELCSRNDMVWLDGRFLTQVDTPQELASGTFYIDRDAHTLEIALPAGDSPAQHRVEVARLGTLFMTENGASFVHVRGFHFTRSASGYGMPVARFGNYATTGWVVADNVADYGSWGGMGLYGSHNLILRNVAAHNGCEGISGIIHDTVLDGNATLYNNWKGIRDTYESGGGKFTESARVLVRNHEAAYNRGPGIWFDINNSDITLDHVRAHDDHYAGIFIEISPGPAVVRDCQCWGNAGAGITIGESNQALLENNVLNQNWDGIELRNLPDRHGPFGEGATKDDHSFQISDVTIRGNYFYHNAKAGLAATAAYLDPVGRHIASDHNIFFDNTPMRWCAARPNDALNGFVPAQVTSANVNGYWIFPSLEGMAKFGFDQHSRADDPQLVNEYMYGAKGAAALPRATEPAAPKAPELPQGVPEFHP